MQTSPGTVRINTKFDEILSRNPIKAMILKRIIASDSLLINDFESLFNQEVSTEDITDVFEQHLSDDQKKGFWFASIRVRDISVDLQDDGNYISIFLAHTHDDIVKLDSLTYSGITQTKFSDLLRESRLELDQVLNPQSLVHANAYLAQSLYIESINSSQLRRYQGNRYGVHFDFKELSTFFLNGIIGYQPENDNSDAFWSSDIQIAYDNIVGTGRAIDFKWQRLNRRSDLIDLNYTEPWLFSLPVNAKASIGRQLIDSIFTTTKFGIALSLPVNHQFTADLFLKFANTNPSDSIRADQNQLPFSEETETGVTLNFTNLDRKYNPKTGLKASLSFSTINTDVLRPEWLIDRYNIKRSTRKERLEFDINYFINHYDNHVILLHNSSRIIESDQVFSNDLYYFGGTKTVRGFRENQFNSDRYSKFSFEYRIVLDADSRLFAFGDTMVFRDLLNRKSRRIGSFGIGTRLKTTIGTLGVDYAIEVGAPFSQGKIHVGLFGQID